MRINPHRYQQVFTLVVLHLIGFSTMLYNMVHIFLLFGFTSYPLLIKGYNLVCILPPFAVLASTPPSYSFVFPALKC